MLFVSPTALSIVSSVQLMNCWIIYMEDMVMSKTLEAILRAVVAAISAFLGAYAGAF